MSTHNILFYEEVDTNTWTVTWRLWKRLTVHLIGVYVVIRLSIFSVKLEAQVGQKSLTWIRLNMIC